MLGPHTHGMALHLFRPAEQGTPPSSPSWRVWRGLVVVAGWSLLARAASLFQSRHCRKVAAYLAVVAGLVVQGALLLTAAYLIDLALSLMELWADLARKHLELTL
jgi:hypothetical protein